MSAAEIIANYRRAHRAVTGRNMPPAPPRIRPLNPVVVEMAAPQPVTEPEPPPPPWDTRLKECWPSARAIIFAVSAEYKVGRRELESMDRTHRVVRPRQLAMYLCRLLTPLSLPEIGRRLGRKDHTTILHGVRVVQMALAQRSPITLTNNMMLSEVVRLHREALEAGRGQAR